MKELNLEDWSFVGRLAYSKKDKLIVCMEEMQALEIHRTLCDVLDDAPSSDNQLSIVDECMSLRHTDYIIEFINGWKVHNPEMAIGEIRLEDVVNEGYL
jgi:hypothetical protein